VGFRLQCKRSEGFIQKGEKHCSCCRTEYSIRQYRTCPALAIGRRRSTAAALSNDRHPINRFQRHRPSPFVVDSTSSFHRRWRPRRAGRACRRPLTTPARPPAPPARSASACIMSSTLSTPSYHRRIILFCLSLHITDFARRPRAGVFTVGDVFTCAVISLRLSLFYFAAPPVYRHRLFLLSSHRPMQVSAPVKSRSYRPRPLCILSSRFRHLHIPVHLSVCLSVCLSPSV